MKDLINKWIEKYGYTPSAWELYGLYSSGGLSLTDKEENELLKYFKDNNINN